MRNNQRSSQKKLQRKKHWYDYLWIWTIIYFALGFFNILFAWLGMIDFLVPLIIAVCGGGKFFCNHCCGRGQLLNLLGTKGKLSRNRTTPRWMSSKAFRYGFLAFFLIMFANMVWNTYLVGAGASSLREAIKLFWTFRVPWSWAYHGSTFPDWVAQYSFGFYSIMLTSTLIGLIVMALYKPRTWCTFCPMGTMTPEYLQAERRRETLIRKKEGEELVRFAIIGISYSGGNAEDLHSEFPPCPGTASRFPHFGSSGAYE